MDKKYFIKERKDVSRMPMKITNLGKLPIEQKGKLPSDENKIKNYTGKLPS